MTTSSTLSRSMRAAYLVVGACVLLGADGCAAMRQQARPVAPPAYDVDIAPIQASFPVQQELRRRLDGVVAGALPSARALAAPTDTPRGILRATIRRSNQYANVGTTTFDYNTYVIHVALINPLGVDAGSSMIEIDVDSGELRADPRAEARMLEQTLRRAMRALFLDPPRQAALAAR